MIEVRPRGVGELLDLATEVLLARFGRLVGISFLVWTVVRVIFAWLGLDQIAEPGPDTSAGEILAPAFMGLGFTFVGTVIISGIAAHVTIHSLLADGMSRIPLTRSLPAVAVVSFLATMMLMVVGVFSFGIGAIVLWYKFLYAPCVVVAERPNPAFALKRSWELTRSSFGRCLGVYVVSIVLGLPLSFAAMEVQTPAVLETLARWAPSLPVMAIETTTLLLAALLQALPSAFSGVVLTALYADALVRREGVDLVARFVTREAKFGRSDLPPQPPPAVEELV